MADNNGIRAEMAMDKIRSVINNYGFPDPQEGQLLWQIADVIVTSQYSAAARCWKVFPDLHNIMINLTKMELTFSSNGVLFALQISRAGWVDAASCTSITASYRMVGQVEGTQGKPGFVHAVNYTAVMQIAVENGHAIIDHSHCNLPPQALAAISNDFIDDDISHAYSINELEQSLGDNEFIMGFTDNGPQYSDSTFIVGIYQASNKFMARVMRIAAAAGIELTPVRWVIVHSD